MKTDAALAVLVFAGLSFAAVPAGAQVSKDPVPGITNFARIETTVACGGATKPEALPEIKKMGFASVINVRVATEPGADVPAEEAAAKAAGLKYVHLPFNASAPDPTLVDNFLKAITTPGVQPAFIHCAGGSRAAALWLIKRVAVDSWNVEQATSEAEALGLASPALKKFALDYVQTHKR
jgi:uncharacterized protein (TIGR01244 family)